MVFSFLLACTLMMVMTPMKMAFFLTISSILMGYMSYICNSSIFCSASLVISFSSGMMILFCFTALMSNFEIKGESKTNQYCLMMVMSIICLLSLSQKNTQFLNSSVLQNFVVSTTIVMMMSMVVITMKAINSTIFNPSKSLISSYYWEKESLYFQ